jgi:hypothetical protein
MLFIVVHEIFEITNSKHQITNKSQITNINDLNDFDNSNIDKDIFFNSFAFYQEQKGLEFEILLIGICLEFGICCLEFPLKQHPV